ncbi:ornithine carbamoyltransferase [Rhabdochromatium marinum]|uniref:ornithine carbamoyltransferase n=1 Tax=Rhabdochromatium marinum TaxID=48729 RepID=UPI0019084246|nr:ornithine carbamoyltransferase [Rhabdochromatium marinum]MBK1647262.1 ornithine carbamoyltransferase [Rhabdochromatium marinum]
MEPLSAGTARHFLTLLDLSAQEAQALIQRAQELKRLQGDPAHPLPLQQRTLAMIFEKSSTRTRVSFEVGMAQLGGHALFLSPRDTQLGRGEPIPDSARVLSRMVDAIMIRTFAHDTLETFAAHSQVPVINGLTDRFHPCQLLADMLTYQEHRGPINGRRVAYIGDGNNMCHSYMNAAKLFDFELHIACPVGFEPDEDLLRATASHCQLSNDPAAAVAGADLLVTDVWASMGQEEQARERRQAFTTFCIDQALLAQAKPDALFMHCLPAHRGEEVSAEVIDGPQSVVWDEAENRLHAQKALLEFLLLEPSVNTA